MEAFFQDSLSYLLLYKYAALFGITFLAAFALPLPSTTSLMTAAGFASQGYMHIGWVIFWATLGNVAADNLAYWIARYYGIALLGKMSPRFTQSRVFNFLTRRLRAHAAGAIFWSRFEVIMTITINILSGIARTNYRKFFLYGFFGEMVQVSLFAGSGYYFGSNLTGELSFFGKFLTGFIVCALIFFFLFRKRLLTYFLNK